MYKMNSSPSIHTQYCSWNQILENVHQDQILYIGASNFKTHFDALGDSRHFLNIKNCAHLGNNIPALRAFFLQNNLTINTKIVLGFGGNTIYPQKERHGTSILYDRAERIKQTRFLRNAVLIVEKTASLLLNNKLVYKPLLSCLFSRFYTRHCSDHNCNGVRYPFLYPELVRKDPIWNSKGIIPQLEFYKYLLLTNVDFKHAVETLWNTNDLFNDLGIVRMKHLKSLRFLRVAQGLTFAPDLIHLTEHSLSLYFEFLAQYMRSYNDKL